MREQTPRADERLSAQPDALESIVRELADIQPGTRLDMVLAVQISGLCDRAREWTKEHPE